MLSCWERGNGETTRILASLVFCSLRFLCSFCFQLFFKLVQSLLLFCFYRFPPSDMYPFSFSFLDSCCSEYPSHSISLLLVLFRCPSSMLWCACKGLRPPILFLVFVYLGPESVGEVIRKSTLLGAQTRGKITMF